MKRLCFAGLLLGVVLSSFPRGHAQSSWPLWESYTKRFLDDQGRVIDRSANDRTTSEGQAYAMFFSLVDNDRARFDKLLNWTEQNLAGGDLTLHLPAWNWGKSSTGEWKVIDDNSASDADLWMVYSLIEAGRLWHEPRYDKLGRTMALRVAKQEVVLVSGLGAALAPGPTGFHPDQETWIINPSYMPLPLLVFLAKTMPHAPWASILKSMPALLGGEVSHRFVMDWVAAGSGGTHPCLAPRQPSSGVRVAQISGSYDAIRAYLWLGMADAATPALKQYLSQTSGMSTYLLSEVTPPLEVDANGKVIRADAPPGFSAALIPYLSAAGMKVQAAAQRDRLAATRDSGTGLYGHAAEYYDQNLALFSTAWSERRFHFERDGSLRVSWK